MKKGMPVIKQSYFGLGFTSAPAARENQYNACFSKKKRKIKLRLKEFTLLINVYEIREAFSLVAYTFYSKTFFLIS